MSFGTEEIKFTQAIFQATSDALDQNLDTFVIGLGVSYQNGADGTMGDLGKRYPNRVLDTPVSEASLTGLALGSAISGMRPIVHHGRVEFALFAADQIITQAAKWNYMFGGGYPAPIVFRIAIGRQWGNGPQHTQALYSLFGGVPGLKVVVPSTPFMAKGLLAAAVKDNNPVVFLEPRWLYQIKQDVPSETYFLSLVNSRMVREGKDFTVVTYGDGVIEAMNAADILSQIGIEIEVIDLVSINPIDYKLVQSSVAKTKRLLTLDISNKAFSVGRSVIAEVSATSSVGLLSAPIMIAAPDVPVPTATSLTENYYPNRYSVVNSILSSYGRSPILASLSFEELHLPPAQKVNF
jgi:pyruvate dehydrogenase E1 component beta subunit